MKRLAAVLALALLLGVGGARLLAGDGSTETVVATGCDPAEAIPTSGTLSLAYTAPSAPPHLDHDDYVLGGRVRWDSQAALDCIGGDADAAYEHEISFDGDFPGRIWRLEHTFPEAAQVYADELVNDDEGRTVLTLGVFRPEHLVAGVDYWFTLDTPLLAEQGAREHRFTLDGEIGSRICSAPNAWCVERSNAEVRRGLIDDGRGFDVALGGCWSWEYDTVSPCSGLTFPAMDEQADGELIEAGTTDGETTNAPAPLDPASGSTPGPASNDGAAGTPGASDTGSAGSADPSTGAANQPSGDTNGATTTTVASQAPPGVTTTTSPAGPGGEPTDPGSATTTSTPRSPSPTSTTPGTTPTTVPGSPTTTPTPTTVRPAPTTTPPATPTTRPPTTTPPTTRPPAVTTTTRPPAVTTTTRPATTTPPTTAPPTTPPTTPPATTPPAVAPSITSISATPGRAGRVRVLAQISWPATATAPSCITTLDGAVVSIKECGSRLTVNLRGVATGTHTIRVRACDRSIACTDSPPVIVTVD